MTTELSDGQSTEQVTCHRSKYFSRKMSQLKEIDSKEGNRTEHKLRLASLEMDNRMSSGTFSNNKVNGVDKPIFSFHASLLLNHHYVCHYPRLSRFTFWFPPLPMRCLDLLTSSQPQPGWSVSFVRLWDILNHWVQSGLLLLYALTRLLETNLTFSWKLMTKKWTRT